MAKKAAAVFSTSPPLTDEQKGQFQERLQKWLEGAQKIVTDDYKGNGWGPKEDGGNGLAIPQLHTTEGGRFITVWRRDTPAVGKGSSHAFIDKTTGDILKPATWRAPAKHARGNLFDDRGGLGQMGVYGPAYLK